MDKLWAPWRVKYIKRVIQETKGCVFCRILKDKKDQKHFILFRTKTMFAVLNVYPYNNGHVLILPKRHMGDLSKLTPPEREDMWEAVLKTQALLEKVLSPGGYNIGLNLGKVAGAGFPGHLHIHIVPRWKGDVNFMPVVAQTKVISQSLRALYQKLKDAYKKRH